MRFPTFAVLLVSLSSVACSSEEEAPAATPTDSGTVSDSGGSDSAPQDSTVDTGTADTNTVSEDSATVDSAKADGGADTKPAETGATDSAAADTGSDVAADSAVTDSGATDSALTDSAATDSVDAAGDTGMVTLTIENYLAWCSVTVNGGAASTANPIVAQVATGSTVNLTAAPADAIWPFRYWVGTTANSNTASTVVMTTSKTIKVCCSNDATCPGF